MQSDNQEAGFILWEEVKELREGYFVSYHPPRSDMWLATLAVSFPTHREPESIAAIMESEFILWARKYPVPLMVSSFDDTDALIDLTPIKTSSHLCGYFDPIADNMTMQWHGMKDAEFPEHLKQREHLQITYADLPARNEKEIKAEVLQHAKQMRLAKRVLLFLAFLWLLVVPAIIEYLGGQYTWFATLLLFFIFGKSSIKWLKLAGYVKPSAKENKQAEEQLKKNHYYYHCEKNPEGFLKLKIDNFDREAKERMNTEIKELRSRS